MQVSFIQKSIVVAFGAVALLGATAGAGQAFNFSESGDTGATLAGAQDPGTPLAAGANSITGRLVANADLFKFTTDQAGTLIAETLGTAIFRRNGTLLAPALANAQLFLFNAAGQGLTGNDDSSGLEAKITYALMASSTYYIGISPSSFDPRSAGQTAGVPNFIFGADDSTLLTSNPLSGWVNRNNNNPLSAGGYTINMAFTPTAVPSPALLPGLAALGFSAIRKRKAKAAVA
jgi:hypothetical protein